MGAASTTANTRNDRLTTQTTPCTPLHECKQPFAMIQLKVR
jgi:hypothetical protein